MRTPDGHDAIVRLIVIQSEGHDHLKILRRIATGEKSLMSNNHTRPMFGEFQFEDLIFGIFPKVGSTMSEAYGRWPKNSVGDVIDMIMQMLEVSLYISCLGYIFIYPKALVFIHDLNVAHRVSSPIRLVLQLKLLMLRSCVSRMLSVTILFFSGIQNPCLR